VEGRDRVSDRESIMGHFEEELKHDRTTVRQAWCRAVTKNSGSQLIFNSRIKDNYKTRK
jgi:hypothetical protein